MTKRTKHIIIAVSITLAILLLTFTRLIAPLSIILIIITVIAGFVIAIYNLIDIFTSYFIRRKES